ncbi:MAG: transposase family protein [Planctomycetaceae bacterium]|jgi:hypothetical protein|nr:transposase family protein [Planctomycetaceae bacterium]
MYSPGVTKTLTQSHHQFKKFAGVSKSIFFQLKSIFFQLLAILRVADVERYQFGGRPSRIPLENQFLGTLQYWREYRTMEHLAYEYNTVVSTVVCPILDEIVWTENALLQDGTFCLQDKKILQHPDSSYQTIAVELTEHPVERLKKQKDWVQVERKNTPHSDNFHLCYHKSRINTTKNLEKRSNLL